MYSSFKDVYFVPVRQDLYIASDNFQTILKTPDDLFNVLNDIKDSTSYLTIPVSNDARFFNEIVVDGEHNLYNFSNQLVAKNYLAQENKRISNVVFMGMGEPLLNESPVYDACQILLDDWAFGLSRRRVTVSSSGIVPALLRMSDTVPVSLAISLHAPEDELRDILVPINKKYPIKELMKACHYYLNAGSQERHILFEYVMLENVNDSIENAKSL